MNEREVGRLLVVETISGPRNWEDRAALSRLGCSGVGRVIGGVCKGGDRIWVSSPVAGEGGSADTKPLEGPEASSSERASAAELRRSPETAGLLARAAGEALSALGRRVRSARRRALSSGDSRTGSPDSGDYSQLPKGHPGWSLGGKVGFGPRWFGESTRRCDGPAGSVAGKRTVDGPF